MQAPQLLQGSLTMAFGSPGSQPTRAPGLSAPQSHPAAPTVQPLCPLTRIHSGRLPHLRLRCAWPDVLLLCVTVLFPPMSNPPDSTIRALSLTSPAPARLTEQRAGAWTCPCVSLKPLCSGPHTLWERHCPQLLLCQTAGPGRTWDLDAGLALLGPDSVPGAPVEVR